MQRKSDGNSEVLPMPPRAVTLREQVVSTLRTAILEFQFRPGQRLIERELCEMMGVSRTSVREAIRHLETEGLIENLAHKGPTVSVVTPDKARYIYELRGALEALAAGLCAKRATATQLKAFQKSFQQVRAAYEALDQRRILPAVNQFYDAMLDGCGNPFIGQVLRSLHGRIVYLRAISITQGRATESLDELEHIVEAVVRRDADAAELACRRHAAHACNAALGALAHGDVLAAEA